MALSVGRVNWEIAEQLLRTVREQVFVYEWRIPKRIEFDTNDRKALHVIVCDDESQEPIATGRILPSGEISRIAVIKPHRNSDADQLVLSYLLKFAKEQHLTEVFINTSLDAVEHYTNQGFQPVGGVYMEAGLPRQRMSFNLSTHLTKIKKYYLSH